MMYKFKMSAQKVIHLVSL